ncbi:MAG: alpha/beta hydrolase [Propionibacterium sp.]|nr:alpha/beta hydrolase [Propionibacterium sp.]
MEPIHVHELGNPAGPTLVLVHGMAEAGTAWPDAVDRWGDRYRLLAIDHRGHGSSPRFNPEDMPTTRSFWRADLTDVLRRQPEPPVVVAFSMGATISLRIAADHPELLRALVLEDPARPSATVEAQQAFVEVQLRTLAAFADGGAERRARLRERTNWSDAEIEAWSDCKTQVDEEMIRHGVGLGEDDLDERLRAIEVPTLVIAPEGGPMAPNPARIRNPLVDIRFIPGAGHSVRRDAPAPYYALVEQFLAQHHPAT